MMEISEEIREYSRRGSRLEKDVYQQLSEQLLLERSKRKCTLEELSQAIGIPADRIERQELRRRKLNWCIIAALLKQYGKMIVLQLVDEE